MHDLLERLVLPAFDTPLLAARHDGAVFEIDGARLAFATDSYVIRPLFFPGGDIGSLAVNGTVNDLAMCGAEPLYLSCALILEEGFPMADLARIVDSMKRAADAAQVQLVTGDTKVVDRGKGDGVFINTAGVGRVRTPLVIAPQSIRAGDALLVSGDLGRHGTAIMAHRAGLPFESTITSDCGCLALAVGTLLAAGLEVYALRDLTRGGLASALVELAEASSLHFHIRQTEIPVLEEVRGACELLGLDPLYMANEGRMLVVLPAGQADRAVAILRAHAIAVEACRIGEVSKPAGAPVTLTSAVGTVRVVDRLSGEQLPRTC